MAGLDPAIPLSKAQPCHVIGIAGSSPAMTRIGSPDPNASVAIRRSLSGRAGLEYGMSDVMTSAASELRDFAERCNAWPFEEARKIVARLKRHPKDEVIFETGYGPSGLPHIGTFGEVARTTMVRHAFRTLTEDRVKTRLIAFSDDMDGLRKVPDNIPEQGPRRAASRQAAHPRARSVRHPRQLRRPQQCAAARLSRCVRLRIRVPLRDRVLHVGPLRRGAAARSSPTTTR